MRARVRGDAGGDGRGGCGMIPFELNKTHRGNNCELIAQLPDACIDLTVTSPPYDDMDLDFNPLSKGGLRTYNGYTWDFKTLATELYRVTKPGGVCVWVVNDPTIDGSESLASSLQKIYFRRVGWNIHDTMIYQKDGISFPDKSRYQQSFEFMFIISKNAPKSINLFSDRKNKQGGGRFFGNDRDSDGTLRKQSGYGNTVKEYGVRWNVWEVHNERETGHPAPFPEALARDHITSWSNPGDLVLDPFSGSGTTGKMALEAGRRFLGFEISQEYTTLANRRTAGAKVPLFDWTGV